MYLYIKYISRNLIFRFVLTNTVTINAILFNDIGSTAITTIIPTELIVVYIIT